MLWRLLIASISSLLLLAACASGPAPAAERERVALQARQSAFLQATSTKDAQQLASYFAEDGVLQIPNIPAVEGRAAIVKFYGNVLRFLSSSTSTQERLEITSETNPAYGSGSVTNVFESPQGRQEFTGQYRLTWQKQQGEWRILAYSLSSGSAETR